MKERPMLFSAPMVRALREGRKTQTRRAVKHRFDHLNREPWYATSRVLTDLPTQPGAWMEFRYREQDEPAFTGSPASTLVRCPYGQPGDRLWVKETFGMTESAPYADGQSDDVTIYRADGWEDDSGHFKWKPSIFMPRRFSRILLEITDIRVERLQEISEEDAKAEGVEPYGDCYCVPYHRLWDSIKGAGSWDANPWVWVVEFRRVEL